MEKLKTLRFKKIVRGICILDKKILLAYSKKQKHYFLPGGHIEEKEKASKALQRELLEECNIKIKKYRYSKTFLNTWKDPKGKKWPEKIFLFYFEIADKKTKPVVSNESHLLFKWVELSKIQKINFLPEKLLGFLTKKERS